MSRMESPTVKNFDLYRRCVAIIGAAICAHSIHSLPISRIDMRLMFFTAITIVLSSRVSVRIPRVNANVTVADSFIFLVLLLYGPDAGILLAAADGLISALRISKRPLTLFFNSAMMATSTLFTAFIAQFFFAVSHQSRLKKLGNLHHGPYHHRPDTIPFEHWFECYWFSSKTQGSALSHMEQ